MGEGAITNCATPQGWVVKGIFVANCCENAGGWGWVGDNIPVAQQSKYFVIPVGALLREIFWRGYQTQCADKEDFPPRSTGTTDALQGCRQPKYLVQICR